MKTRAPNATTLRSSLAIYRLGGWRLILLLYTMLLALGAYVMLARPIEASDCVVDAQTAAAAGRDGQLSYSGSCITFESPVPLTESQAQDFVRDANEFLKSRLEPISGPSLVPTVSTMVSGYPGVILSVSLGLLALGWPLESGVAALLVANGFTRRRFLAGQMVSGLTLLVSLFIVGVALTTLAALLVAAAYDWNLAVALSPGSVLKSLTYPVPGLLAYFGIGSLLGVLLRRGLAGWAAGIAILIAEVLFLPGGAFRPVTLHGRMLLELSDRPWWGTPSDELPFVHPLPSALMLLAFSMLVSVLVWMVLERRDVPDRPRLVG